MTTCPGSKATCAPPVADPPQYWDGAVFRKRVPGRNFDAGGCCKKPYSNHLVSGAPELVTPISLPHQIGGQRTQLVYGGHTIGQAYCAGNPAIVNLATVLDWESQDHTARYEGMYLQRAAYRVRAGPRRRGYAGTVLVYAVAIRRVSPIGRCSTGVLAPGTVGSVTAPKAARNRCTD